MLMRAGLNERKSLCYIVMMKCEYHLYCGQIARISRGPSLGPNFKVMTSSFGQCYSNAIHIRQVM